MTENLLIEEIKISELKVGDKVLIDSKKRTVRSISSPFQLEIEYSKDDDADSHYKATYYDEDGKIYRIIKDSGETKTKDITVKVEEISKEKFDSLMEAGKNMPVATHVIKIKVEFDENWNEEKLKELIKSKAKEVDKFFALDLELFKVENNVMDVWFFIEFCYVKLSRVKDMSDKWFKDHIKEDGITIKSLDVEDVPHGGLRVCLNDVSLKGL